MVVGGYIQRRKIGLDGQIDALYGLKQSPGLGSLAWLFRSFLCHSALGLCMYLVVYIDDIIITGNDDKGITTLKNHLFQHFQTKDLGL